MNGVDQVNCKLCGKIYSSYRAFKKHCQTISHVNNETLANNNKNNNDGSVKKEDDSDDGDAASTNSDSVDQHIDEEFSNNNNNNSTNQTKRQRIDDDKVSLPKTLQYKVSQSFLNLVFLYKKNVFVVKK